MSTTWGEITDGIDATYKCEVYTSMSGICLFVTDDNRNSLKFWVKTEEAYRELTDALRLAADSYGWKESGK